MSKREKIEIKPSLKAQDYKEGEVVKSSIPIKDIVDVETKFGDKTIITLEDGDAVFLNAESNNNLVDSFGKEDEHWKGKYVSVICKKDNVFGKLMLVIQPITATRP